jgi:hypothetical protein
VEETLAKEIGDDWVQVGNKGDVQADVQKQQQAGAPEESAHSAADSVEAGSDKDQLPSGHDPTEL